MAHEHLADLLDLDAEVLSDYHREVAEWVSANLTERACVIDVGAGTGTGTLALARQLPDAEVIALDVDEEMLKHIQDKARASGLADRIRTVQADLDQAWPDGLKAADLVWAANSLHHMGDPARAVAQIYQMLRPGGLLAVTELESFPRFLTDPAGAALEERIHTAMARGRDEAGMHMHEDWPARLDRKSTRLNSSHSQISYAVFCLKKKKKKHDQILVELPPNLCGYAILIGRSVIRRPIQHDEQRVQSVHRHIKIRIRSS